VLYVDVRRGDAEPDRWNDDKKMSNRAPDLIDALRQWRSRDRKTQEGGARSLSISRKTYLLFESGQWLPPVRERHFFAHVLHGIDPALAAAFARVCETTPQALGLPKKTTVVLLEAGPAKAVYDAAVYSAAETADIPAKTARALVAAVVKKLAEAGITMDQAAELGRASPR
jgi:DNA-binding XRE family transcriptional regulator